MAQKAEGPAYMDVPEDERSVWRRRLPGLVVISTLAVVAASVWAGVLRAESDEAGQTSCPAAPEAGHLTPLPHGALRGVAPLPPNQVPLRVRNSTNHHKLAARVTARLQLLGFGRVLPPDNDTIYPTDAMRCVGQIRFGVQGRAAARTLSLVAPCMQLVRDDARTDHAVELVVGTEFSSLSPGPRAREVLEALRARESDPTHAGGLQSLSGSPTTSSTLVDRRAC